MPVNGYGIKIYDDRDKGSHVAVGQQVGGLFRFNVDVARKGHRSSDVSRDKRYTAPDAIPNEHTYTDILEPEEPKRQEILIPIASTPTIKRPAADSISKGGNSGGGSSAGQLKDCAGSSDENDDEDQDMDDPPVVINKSKKTYFTRELTGLTENLASAWEAPAGSHRRRSRTDYRRRRSGRMEIGSAEADLPVQAEAHDVVPRRSSGFG